MEIESINEFELVSERLIIKVLNDTYAEKVVDYYKRNTEHFQYALADFNYENFSIEKQTDLFWSEFELMVEEKAIRFYIFHKDDILFNNIIGDISISNIIRGNFQSCNLGFKLDKGEIRKGLMFEALDKVIEYLFNLLKLHRIEAEIIVGNIQAIKLLQKLNFRGEGLCYDFLKIDGKWKNYLRFSLINNH